MSSFTGRMAGTFIELHFRNHGPSKGCSISSSWIIPDEYGNSNCLGITPSPALSLLCTYVSLQWLGPRLDHDISWLQQWFACVIQSESCFLILLDQSQCNALWRRSCLLNMLANAPTEEQKHFDRSIKVMTAGAPPPAKVLESMTEFGFDVCMYMV